MLPFQNLNVYARSLDFLRLVTPLADRCPTQHKELADQLRRAALSIPLNIAEGNGKTGKDGRRYYQIARGSVMECGAIVDAATIFGLVTAEEQKDAAQLLDEMVAMLTRMTRP
jgi:four helix bundle protein